MPERIPARPPTSRPPDGIYHFLAPDKDMSNYGDKVVKGMCPKEMKRILPDWRKELFWREVRRLQRLRHRLCA